MPGNFFGESTFCLRFSEKLTFEAINAHLSMLIYHKSQSMIVNAAGINIVKLEMDIIVHFVAIFEVKMEH